MRSEPAHLAEISLDFAGISARRNEIFLNTGQKSSRLSESARSPGQLSSIWTAPKSGYTIFEF